VVGRHHHHDISLHEHRRVDVGGRLVTGEQVDQAKLDGRINGKDVDAA
jgi:hypothetical protein